MKKYDYYRPSAASLGRKKRVVRRKGSSFFFKLFLLLVLVGVVGCGGWLALSKGYRLLVNSQITDWHAKTIQVSGVTGQLGKEIAALAEPHEGKAFSVKDAAALRDTVVKRYPMLKDVAVKRGLLSGKLTVSAAHRTPIAKFVLPDDSVRYIDEDSTVYPDPHPDLLSPVPFVELSGSVPQKLSPEFIDLVQSTLKLNKELDFAFLQMDLEKNTVKMHMPDGCIIDFGQAEQLKKKALVAARILAFSRERYGQLQKLDFQFFKYGKVFLTQTSH